MKKEYSDLPGWVFELKEVSAGVYQVAGKDPVGHRVFAQGTDLDSLIEECRQEAVKFLK